MSSNLEAKGYARVVTQGITTRSKDATRGDPGLTTRNKKLLVTKGIATRSKDATRSKGHFYYYKKLLAAPGIATSNKMHRLLLVGHRVR